MFTVIERVGLAVTDFWMVILHNRNTYLPGMHKVFGSTYKTSIPMALPDKKKNQYCAFTLSMTESRYMNLGGKLGCVAGRDVNMEECVDEYVAKKVGCRYMIMCQQS